MSDRLRRYPPPAPTRSSLPATRSATSSRSPSTAPSSSAICSPSRRCWTASTEYPGSMTSFDLRAGEAPSGGRAPRGARRRAAGVRVRRPALHPRAGASACAARGDACHVGHRLRPRVHRAAARARATAASATPCSRCRSRRASTRTRRPTTTSSARRTSRPTPSTSPSWARDAVALALPEKILCRPDCAGLCPECGKNLNDEPHEHEAGHGRSALGGARRTTRPALASVSRRAAPGSGVPARGGAEGGTRGSRAYQRPVERLAQICRKGHLALAVSWN